MLRVAPDHATLWREAALMHQRLDQVGAALRCFERFLIWCRKASPPRASVPPSTSCGCG